jgi:TrmH family RNA methyltransferase
MSRALRDRPPGKVLSISSHANPRIKAVRALLQPKHRRESGLFIAEGLKLVTDALSGGWRVEALIHQADAIEQPAVAKAAAAARAQGADILSVSADILAKISRRDNPHTVIGVVEQSLTAIDDLAPDEQSTWIALDHVKDPGNLGTIIRTADAAGAEGVILVGSSVDPFSIEAVRATMGSLFHVPIVRAGETEFLDFRHRWPGRVIGTHLTGTVDFRAGDYRRPVLLVMGNEQTGLSDPLARACDQLVRIPMAGRADSLNLAVATAVMLYEIRRGQLTL